MKLVKTFFALVFGLVLISGLFAGGSRESAVSGSTDLVFLRAGIDDNGRNFWQSVIDDYVRVNPNVRIELQEAPWGDEIETRLNLGFASGTVPDVLSFNIASLGLRVPLGQYEPLDRYFANWEGRNDLMEAMKNIGMVGDTLYGITYGPNPLVFMWREDLFQRAGLDPSRPPRNWNELLQFHERLTVREGGQVVQTGMAFPTTGTNSYQFYQALIMQNGIANFVDEGTNTILFNSPAGVEALELIGNMARAGYIPFNNNTDDNSPFVRGQAAMTIGGIGTYNRVVASPEWGGYVRVAGAPITQRQQATFCGANLFYITSQSRNKDASWDFIEFNMTPDILWRSYEIIGSPVVRHSMVDRFTARNPELNAAIVEGVRFGTGVVKVPYVWSMLPHIVTAIERTVLGMASPRDALQEAYNATRAEVYSF